MPLTEMPPRPGRSLLREEAYAQLRDLIVQGVLEPGETVRDTDLADWLGGSRTPVREALTRLADDGLVEMAPNRYTRVSPLSARDALEAHLLLDLLDGEVGAAARPAPTELDAIRAESDRFTWAVWRSDDDEALAADRALNAALRRSASAGPLLLRMVDRADALARRAQRRTWPSLVLAWPSDAHPSLLRALEQGDAEAARAAIAGEWRAVGTAAAAAIGPGGLV